MVLHSELQKILKKILELKNDLQTHPDAPHGFFRGASHSEDRYVCECEFWEEPKMNERTRQLAGQALDRVVPYTWTRLDYDEIQRLQEYFAELIVRECLTIVDGLVDRQADGTWTSNELYTDYNGALSEVKRRIEEHFGVEL